MGLVLDHYIYALMPKLNHTRLLIFTLHYDLFTFKSIVCATVTEIKKEGSVSVGGMVLLQLAFGTMTERSQTSHGLVTALH